MTQTPLETPVPSQWRRDLVRFLVGASVMPMLIIGAMVLVAGRTGFEKGVIRFAQPDAFFWTLLTGAVAIAFRKERWGGTLTLVWLVYTIGGSSFLAGAVNQYLEAPYLQIRPTEMQEPLRYSVVLGGGTTIGGNQEAQLGGAGDRVMIAARLLLSGKTEKLICTGAPIAGLSRPGLPTASEQTERILLDLGASRESLIMVGGRNTYEEMQAIRELFEQSGVPADEPLGIVTSAWHMRRAERLARAAGLNPQPLPADFRTSPAWITPESFVPSAGAMKDLGSAAREVLARLVGR